MNIFGSGANSQQVTEYTSLQLQTSAQGVCIPIAWGQNVLAPNLIWQNDFVATPVSGKGGGKGGGGKGATQYTYAEALILALCEGPIEGINQVWSNGALTTLAALNLSLVLGTPTQSPPSYIVSNHPTEALAYAYTAYLFSSSYSLGNSAALPSHKFEINGALFETMPGSTDANFADIILDYLTNAQYGVTGFPASTIDMDGWDRFKTYCTAQKLWASPILASQEQAVSTLQRWVALCNTWIFWSGNMLRFVPLGDSEITANGVTYTPVTDIVYDLGPDDFIFDPKSESPVVVSIIDPADGYNRVELDVRDRSNAYVDTPVYWEDQATMDDLGLLQSNTISAPEICDTGVAAVMAALIGQRSVYLRNTYAFKLPYTFILLETGDLVTLTVPDIGLDHFPVRIKTVDEQEDMLLAFTAEEYFGTVGTVLYPRPQQPGTGTPPPNRLADPGDINAPLIFEPSPEVTAGAPQVWLGASGGADWGGADVFISTNGSDYAWIGRITVPTQQGVLTAFLPSHADPDLADTLSVDTSASASILSTSVSPADADAFRTSLLISSELVAYGTVTPTSTFGADLTYLRRGVYGTTISGHLFGTPFSRINPNAILAYTLPAAYVGVLLYFKFTSFNVFGAAEQEIGAVPFYTYSPTGVAYTILPPPSATLGTTSVLQPDGTTLVSMTTFWSASPGPMVGSYEVEYSLDSGVTWTADVKVGALALSYTLSPALSGTLYMSRVRAISQSGLAMSDWAYTAVVESAVIPPTPGGVVPFPYPVARAKPPVELDDYANRRATMLQRPTHGGVPLVDANGNPVLDANGNPVAAYDI